MESRVKLDLTAPENMLLVGNAAEHIVCADLILQGYRAFLADHGSPYDVIADMGDRLLRVQVKGCLQPRNCAAGDRDEQVRYSWNIRRGRHGNQKFTAENCDVIALVALDIRAVAYVPITRSRLTIQLLPCGVEPKTYKNRVFGSSVDSYPLHTALEGLRR